MDVRTVLVEAALENGFVLADTIDLNAIESDPSGLFLKHVEAYDRWLAQGSQGEMTYLVRGRDRRANPRLVFPDAQSALCVAIPYPARPAGAPDPETGARYARYLQGPDYHEVLKEKLDATLQQAQKVIPELRGKPCVDTSAVLERSLCMLAGLGWIGKNTMLIHPQWGSYLFLGVLLLNLQTGQGPKPLPDYCGNCNRCLEGCPTGALTAPKTLDSRKCISYLTLEKRGPFTDSEKSKIGNWVAGCDICQEVCPFNTKASRRSELSGSVEANCTQVNRWDELEGESEEAYRLRIQNSALSRIKFPDFKRNIAAALGND